ncbi:MAG: hypothetical protein H7305_03750 [Gemmatimonadaceae bacterium]|nr:hypothetical protein [Gemmatimonadaceae bacterium]
MTATYLVGIAQKLQLNSGEFPSGRAVREAALREALVAQRTDEDPPRCSSKRATDAAMA